ncbi:acyl carrier protein [Streptomyces alboniger]|nr:acyl carrier protein [Streptomyces alboniger]
MQRPGHPDTQHPSHTAAHIRSTVAGVLDLNVNEIDDDQDFINFYRADSLNLIEIVAQLEKHYQLELPPNQLHHARTINSLNNLITSLLNTPRIPDITS